MQVLCLSEFKGLGQQVPHASGLAFVPGDLGQKCKLVGVMVPLPEKNIQSAT